jgi:hypothetical protein
VSYETAGYDGLKGDVQWWFESWGRGEKHDWHVRSDVGHPPSPSDLRNASYITFGLRYADGHEEYRTRRGGLDV